LHEQDYLATSENTKLPALKSFRKSEKRLAKISRRKCAQKKGLVILGFRKLMS